MINRPKKAVLIILDGWGYGRGDNSNAIYNANTPFFDELISKYPNSRLQASGEAVGLPEGQMGNSEVGHLNIGAGRVVYQELRSEEHTSELQSLMRISYADFCLKKK